MSCYDQHLIAIANLCDIAAPIGPPTYPEWELIVEPEDAYGGGGAANDAQTDRCCPA